MFTFLRFSCLQLSFFMLMTMPAFAMQDGFGNEKNTVLPGRNIQAFGESADDSASLSAIAPAAGGDNDVKIQPAQKAPAPVTDGQGRAQDPDIKAGQELEKRYGEGAERQVSDHGKGMTDTTDTYGGDTVNVFQRESTKGSVLDKDTAAGVQIKVLKFK